MLYCVMSLYTTMGLNLMKGICLCGGVTFETTETITEATACHCGMCNKWSSSAFIAVQLAEAFSISGEDNIASYRSSEWAERYFCKKCGTLLYYKLISPESFHFNAALFPLQPQIKNLSLEIFTDNKPAYYRFLDENSRKMTEQDVIDSMSSGTSA